MSGPPYDLVGASAYAFVALVWGIVAIDAWSFRLASHPRNALSRLLAPLTTTLASYYVVYALVALLLPSHSGTAAPRWFDLTDVALLASIALFRHLAWHTRFDTTAPSRSWLVLVYGSAALLAAAQVFPELIPAATADARKTLARIPLPFYVVGMLALGLRDMRRFARPGRWTSSAVAARAADVLTVALLVVGAATVFAVITATARERWTAGYQQPLPLLNAGLGLLLDLGGLVRTTLEQLRGRLEDARVAVDLQADGAVLVRADREKLRQVLLNLVENALDAMRAACGRLAVAVQNGRHSALLRVSDSGPGVPAEAVPRLFEPFFSLKPQGTGLGLAIVKRTVDEHGGHVAARPGEDGGLRIDVELPLAGVPA